MINYLPNSKKSEAIKKLTNEALDILNGVGIPFSGKTERGLESMALAFLAVAGVKKSWKEAQGQNEHRHIKTRDIIKFINENFEEKISSGSYDDVRRKHLKLLVLSDLVLNSANNPGAAPNDPTRGYTLSGEFKSLITYYNTEEWDIKLKLFNKNRPSLSEILQRKRDLPKVRVTLSTGHILDFARGGHNQLQREIIEEFLPRFGGQCEVLYIGDATDKYLLRNDDKLRALGFFELTHDSLPDVVAYNKDKNWIFLIEAFYTSGPMSEERILELKKALKDCVADMIFVTAFTSKADFRKNISDIGWETEVWTADNPDHLVHFNGGKFLGPYTEKKA
ncbi:BsuBI/PstI family type II restriction endonuclease [Mucilaginibacter sp. L3T2-6]|uniref:BsuBI/PstI family type II restriction endonuclease n=1 Tax=Mucilaginibacter sp. L3T2-6 TaxID=3062491 RepID=UPI002674B978|nr:BsuBI/PstI family type II restriction endonuclease [Mucilaginibacter sp. L3T2-6]MDO3641218.1 BsuBI/PstI family type II restriction endonuclease [Mucilaginibacter sp. L3T2-6]MDV6213306.1 BsuBI/PstI family type II restriction endonuclease [Mucilaginibacter sp. L3T2-6]